MANWILGVTGGIGSGKSLACQYFASEGIDIVDADIEARNVVKPGEPVLDAIAGYFGASIILADGHLDRTALRQRIFQHQEARLWLEAQLHPLIRERIALLLQRSDSVYTLLVSPLLFESHQEQFCQRTLLIDAPEPLQLHWAQQRDQATEAQIRAIMASQWTRTQRQEKADDKVLNDGSVADLYQQLQPLHQQYLRLANALHLRH